MKDEDIKLPEIKGSYFEDYMDKSISAVKEYARQAVRMNMPASKQSDPEPFDLARAMTGEPIVTRDGRKAELIAFHDSENIKTPVVVLINGDTKLNAVTKRGTFREDQINHDYDLFMAPKPKRTVWVNVWVNGRGCITTTEEPYSEKKDAENAANMHGVFFKYLAIAHPIEIDATE